MFDGVLFTSFKNVTLTVRIAEASVRVFLTVSVALAKATFVSSSILVLAKWPQRAY